jgi:hypothetical protein
VNRPALPGERGRESPLWINQHCGGSGQMIEGSTNVIVGG